ncbi:MAG: trypsin-like peptidase domain-containing protein [Planctomycetes bacterium]|nr:trypsin-like peptidase domain-containing protein [Planctomycetota bacterium]
MLAGCASDGPVDPAQLYSSTRIASVEVVVGGRISGSGWFADRKGTVVTAAHVIGASREGIEILQADGQRRPVRVVAVDWGHDLALLHDAEANSKYPFLKISDEMPSPAQPVYFYGLALYHHNIIIKGTVARERPTFNYFGDRNMVMRAYHVAAPSPSGTSGGPWLDDRGRVVGGQSGFMTHNGAGAGIAIVTPPDAISHLVKTRRSVFTPTMGCGFEELWTQPRGFIKRFAKGTEGIVTVPIHEGGPAQAAGLTKESLIVAIDGENVRLREDFHETILSHKPGDEVVLSIIEPDSKTPHEVRLRLGQLSM